MRYFNEDNEFVDSYMGFLHMLVSNPIQYFSFAIFCIGQCNGRKVTAKPQNLSTYNIGRSFIAASYIYFWLQLFCCSISFIGSQVVSSVTRWLQSYDACIHDAFVRSMLPCIPKRWSNEEIKCSRLKKKGRDESGRMLLEDCIKFTAYMRRMSAKGTNQSDCGGDFAH